MKKAFTALALMLAITVGSPATAEPLSYEEAAEKLVASVGKLKQNGREVCTTWKMDDKAWATAWHCVALTGKKYEIKTNPFDGRDFGITLTPKSALLPMEKADDKDHWEDWAVLNVRDTTDKIPALKVACEYDVKVGEQVAYMGFPVAPGGLQQHFSVGIVNGVNNNRKRPYHFKAQLTGGPGASGSPVLSLKTGEVIGFVTRAVPTRGSLLAVGMESVNSMDICDDGARDTVRSGTTRGGLYGSF